MAFGTGSPVVASIQGAALSFAGAGNHVIVAGVPGKRIYVYGLFITVDAPTDLTLLSGATPLSGAVKATPGKDITLPLNAMPYFTTITGDNLIISSSAAVNAAGAITFKIDT